MTSMRSLGLALLILLGTGGPSWSGPDQEQGSAYLVYAGPYSSSPASTFGHLFLVLRTDDGQPLPLWPVLGFTADTEGAGLLRFFVVGITGGFLGSFKTHPFHEQVLEYEALEDRDLWLVRLRLVDDQWQRLAAAGAALADRRFPYLFFTRNCAYYLQQMLAGVLDLPPPRGFVSPVGVVQAVLAADLGEAVFYRPALSRRLAEQAHGLPPDLLRRLRRNPWQTLAADEPWLRGLPPRQRRFCQDYFQWRTLHQESALAPAALQGLASLRLWNARDADPASPDPAAARPGQPTTFPRFHPYGKWTVSTLARSGDPLRFALRFRPALHELADPWTGFRRLNTLEALGGELSVTARDPQPRLERLVLFSQRTLVPATVFASPSSWLLDISARRGPVFADEALESGVRGGWGRTRRLGGEAYGHLLATGAFLGNLDHGVALVPGLQAGLTVLAGESSRGGVQWDWGRAVFRGGRAHGELEVWLARDLAPNWGTTLHLGAADGGECSARWGLSWYP